MAGAREWTAFFDEEFGDLPTEPVLYFKSPIIREKKKEW